MALNYPLQDGFETILTQDLTAAGTTAYIKVAPTFNFPAGVKTYVVINPQKSNMELVEIDAYDSSAKTLNITTRGLSLSQGVAGTAYAHSTGSRVLISDNMKFWKDLADSFALKLDKTGGTISGTVDFNSDDNDAILRLPNMTEAVRDTIASPQNGMKIYNTTSGTEQIYDGGAWYDMALAPAADNGSETVNGIWQGATTSEMGSHTETGTTGGKLIVMNKNLVKTSSGASDENKIPVLNSSGQLASGFVDVASVVSTTSDIPYYHTYPCGEDITTKKLVYYDRNTNSIKTFNGDTLGYKEEAYIRGFANGAGNAPLTSSGFNAGDANEYYSFASTTNYVSGAATPATLKSTFTNSDTANLASINQTYASVTTSTNLQYCYQMLEFDSASKTTANLVKLDIQFVGSAGETTNALTQGFDVYAYNNNTLVWDSVYSTTSRYTTGDDNYTYEIFSNTSLSPYINGSKKLYVLIKTKGTSNGSLTLNLRADYAKAVYYESVSVQEKGVVTGLSGLDSGLWHFPAKAITTGTLTNNGPAKSGTQSIKITAGQKGGYATQLTNTAFCGFIQSITFEAAAAAGSPQMEVCIVPATLASITGASAAGGIFAQTITTSTSTTEYTVTPNLWINGESVIIFRSLDATNAISVTNAAGGLYKTFDIGAAWSSSSSGSAWTKTVVTKYLANKAIGDVAIMNYNTKFSPVGLALSSTTLLLGKPRHTPFLAGSTTMTTSSTAASSWTNVAACPPTAYETGFTPKYIRASVKHNFGASGYTTYVGAGLNTSGMYVNNVGTTTTSASTSSCDVGFYLQPNGLIWYGYYTSTGYASLVVNSFEAQP